MPSSRASATFMLMTPWANLMLPLAQGDAAPAVRLLDLLWVMADDRLPYRPRIKASAAESIVPVTGLRGLKGHRGQTLERCVNNVKEGRAVVTSLKVLVCEHVGDYGEDRAAGESCGGASCGRRSGLAGLEEQRSVEVPCFGPVFAQPECLRLVLCLCWPTKSVGVPVAES